MAKLGASSVLHDREVEASNWMGALRAAREAMQERSNLPPGSSCSVDELGVTTVLDPESRRKFVLTPIAGSTVEAAPAAAPEPAVSAKAKRFQTVAMVPEQLQMAAPARAPQPAPNVAAQPTAAAPQHEPASAAETATAAAAPLTPAAVHASVDHTTAKTTPDLLAVAAPAADRAPPRRKRFQTVGFSDPSHPKKSSASTRPAAQTVKAPEASVPLAPPVAHVAAGRARPNFSLLFERSDEPTPENPLVYRERAFLLPPGSTVAEAEAALRFRLADLQRDLDGRPRGKLINLAVFDHAWTDAPLRPPLVALQWRDWRAEVSVEYPAAPRQSSTPPSSPAPHDDRLADVFEALEALSHLHTPVEGLDLTVKLLEATIPSEATSACLYDINTDQMRFVAVRGTGAAEAQGRAVGVDAGLLGQACRAEHNATVFVSAAMESAFDPNTDSRPGLQPRSMLMRPIIHERQLLGILQLINRRQVSEFSVDDVHIINYVAERLADFLFSVRTSTKGPVAR